MVRDRLAGGGGRAGRTPGVPAGKGCTFPDGRKGSRSGRRTWPSRPGRPGAGRHRGRRCGRPFRRKGCSCSGGESGREPLCRFLGAPIPDMPFPQTNERAAFHRKRPRRQLKLIVRGR
ncbi:sulfotransferase [Streptosporangium sp. H16]|uniref:sulfotransferase n=1 Tax=Streptosporangium sp. H16 TaxID=3444184 RepID=UPI003F78F2A3